MGFTSNDPEEVKAVKEIEKLIDFATASHAARQDSFLSSFAGQLTLIAKVLRTCHMPQETINMVLAARCGLPMQKIDLKSPCFVWVDGAEVSEAATDATSEEESKEERFRRLRAKALSVVESAGWEEGLNVLASALNEFAALYGHGVKSTLHPLVCSEGCSNG